MKTTQHTPLPWTHSSYADDCYIMSEHGNKAVAICEVFQQGKPEHDANKRFIVTACNAHYELLEACKAIAALMKQPVQTSGVRQQATCDILRADCRMALNLALNAIQSAQGKE